MDPKTCAVWASWVRGELVESLQAKGKLPKPTGEARGRREAAYHRTSDRIFPPALTEEGVCGAMLQEAHARISAAEAARGTQAAAAQQRGAPRGGPPAPVGQHGQGAASGSGGCGGSGACGSSGSGKTLGKPGVNSNPERRKELKARMAEVQKQLEQERAACKALRSGTAAAAAKGAAGGADVQD